MLKVVVITILPLLIGVLPLFLFHQFLPIAFQPYLIINISPASGKIMGLFLDSFSTCLHGTYLPVPDDSALPKFDSGWLLLCLGNVFITCVARGIEAKSAVVIVTGHDRFSMSLFVVQFNMIFQWF